MTAAPRAKKSLGQHFLKDAKTSARIVDLLRIGPEDRVLEIGPGPGAITGIIHERGPAEFRLIEKDSYWAAYHAELERPAPAVQVLNADALAFPWESLEGPWKIISNLPYNVGSPLMWDIVSRTPDLTRAVFMVQKEVAERMQARPKEKEYGALSIAVQYYCDAKLDMIVQPACFMPRPKVASAVITLKVLPERKVKTADEKLFFHLVKCAFGQRRKTLMNCLFHLGNLGFSKEELAELLEELGWDTRVRGEALGLEEFAALTDKIAQKKANI